MQRIGLKIGDLYSEEALSEKLDVILPIKNKQLKELYNLKTYTKDEVLELCKKYAEIFKPYVCFEWQDLLRDAKREGKKILFEGAQGAMLCLDHGTYPYVTSSSPLASSVPLNAGIAPRYIDTVVGICKAYTTRVGAGPFPTELDNELGQMIRERGHEYGTVTKRPRRVGYLDAVVLKNAVRIAGVTSWSLMLFDVLTGIDELKICTHYELDGKLIDYEPGTLSVFERCKPVYITVPGWTEDITHVTSFDELPENAKNYIRKIEELTGVSVDMFSVGPDRVQTIVRKKVF
jgi:adenylosuccinate synthase